MGPASLRPSRQAGEELIATMTKRPRQKALWLWSLKLKSVVPESEWWVDRKHQCRARPASAPGPCHSLTWTSPAAESRGQGVEGWKRGWVGVRGPWTCWVLEATGRAVLELILEGGAKGRKAIVPS
jgi:hypothetical protein